MSYVDGYVIAVPNENKKRYLELAEKSADAFLEAGAIEVVETWGDDVPAGELTSFPLAVKKEDNESIVFAWTIWPSKRAREAGLATAMEKLEKIFADHEPPFDGKRMIYGSFTEMLRRSQ